VHLCFKCIQATDAWASLTQDVKEESRASRGLNEERGEAKRDIKGDWSADVRD
jgi:hypothetical protein